MMISLGRSRIDLQFQPPRSAEEDGYKDDPKESFSEDGECFTWSQVALTGHPDVPDTED